MNLQQSQPAERSLKTPDVLERITRNLSENQLRLLIDSEIFGVIVSDVSGAIVEANDAFLAMIGYTRDELRLGLINWRALTPPKWAASDDNAVREMARTGIVAPYFKEYVHKDGHRVPIALSGVRVLGSADRKVCCIVDLSQTMPSFSERDAPLLVGTLPLVGHAIAATKARYGLTHREGEVFSELLHGHSNAEIADTLCISPTTASDHVRNILRKMNIQSRNQVFAKVIFADSERVSRAPDTRAC